MAYTSYNISEVARLTGLSEQAVFTLVEAGLVGGRRARRACQCHQAGGPRQRPTSPQQAKAASATAPTDEPGRRPVRFNFTDLKILRMAGGLQSAGLLPARIVSALTRLKRQAAARHLPLTGAHVTSEDGRVLASDGNKVWDVEQGVTIACVCHRRAIPAPQQLNQDKPKAAVARVTATVMPSAPSGRLPFSGAGDQADAWFERAYRLEEASPGRAFALYLRALACDPEHVEALINVGRLCSAEKDPSRAAAYFRLATRVDGGHPVAHFNLAVTLHDMGDTEAAVAAYRLALLHDPHFADAHYNLGTLLEQRGDAQEAYRHFDAFRAALSDSPLP